MRVYNFSAGPACLPEVVLKRAQSEMLEYGQSGMSVMEMSHRSKAYMAIIEKAEADLRGLMNIPENYKVLFLQGGASLQFAMVPANLMVKNKKIDLVNTGAWTKKALTEAKKFGSVNVVADSSDKTFSYIPELDKTKFSKDADYFYICTNNTIYGTKYSQLPETGDVPLVADMSSNILSEVIDVSRFGLIFAGAQKNIGPAGLTIVIVREDLVGKAPEGTMTMLDYKTHVDNESMFNTPPTYSIYIAGLVFEWLKERGGIEAMEKINREKASLLYRALDGAKGIKAFIQNKADRSIMNVPFVLESEEMTEKFLKEASGHGLVTLKGHRSVGGCRASIYNSMPIEGVEKLANFIKEFDAGNS